MTATDTKLSFTEEMKGFVSFGESDYYAGFKKGKESDTFIMFHLTITVDGVDNFIADPEHDTDNVKGYVKCDALGGEMPVEKARFNLFVDTDDPLRKNMLYRLFFRDKNGDPLTLSGFKDIKDDPGLDLWSDTTTLFTRVFKGHISTEEESSIKADPAKLQESLVASGIINIYFFDFLKQLTTFRVQAPTLAEKASALTGFGKLFLGALWDIYASTILDSPELEQWDI